MSTRINSSKRGKITSEKAEVNIWPVDAIERTIIERDIRIVDLHFNKDMDLLMVVLNTRDVLRIPLSAYPSLVNATAKKIQEWELLGNGYGVHWPKLDEHLSLKGFMRDAMVDEFMHRWAAPGKVSGAKKKARA